MQQLFGYTNTKIQILELIDSALLKGILKAHSKTPTEFLHLETGTVPLRWVIAQKRFNYLRHILSRSHDELIKKVFLAQKEHPVEKRLKRF